MDREWHDVKNKMLPIEYKQKTYQQQLDKLEELKGPDAELEHVVEAREALRSKIVKMDVSFDLKIPWLRVESGGLMVEVSRVEGWGWGVGGMGLGSTKAQRSKEAVIQRLSVWCFPAMPVDCISFETMIYF